MLKDDFPRIWVPSWQNRDLRQLLWHRLRSLRSSLPASLMPAHVAKLPNRTPTALPFPRRWTKQVGQSVADEVHDPAAFTGEASPCATSVK